MITVKGVEVRPDEVDLETEFQFLTAEGQKRLFLENKEAFLIEALTSNYSTVRRLLWEPEVLKSCSSVLLNDAIRICFLSKTLRTDIMVLMNAVGSELSDLNRELIACASWTCYENWMSLKVFIAQDEKTSLEILKIDEMFKLASIELVQSRDARLFDAIVTNPNFRVDDDIEEAISEISPEGRKIIRERIAELKK